MPFTQRNLPGDVFSLGEIAQASGVPEARIRALIAQGRLTPISPKSDYVSSGQAVAAVRQLRIDGGRSAMMLFDAPEFEHASTRLPIAVSSAFHATVAASLILISAVGLPQAAERTRVDLEPATTRLVFIASPGPGGGGGGGGLRQRTPPPRAERKGKASLSSPVPMRKAPEPIVPVAKPEPPPPPPPVEPEPLPPVVAPVATVAANERDRAGVIDEPAPKESESRGSGTGGGVGSGQGTGLGSGDGSGIGDGSGGGMGGGPYRPGSGIAAPRLLKEVKAAYTEEARVKNLEGEVVLEIVVRRDGSVGDVRLVAGLPSGLNDRAIAAVRQWRFAPATRLGQPVDILVEVAVEFKLR
jgi:periplasmic protein TonB